MKHFIATRFNLKVSSWKTSKDGSDVLTKEWLEHRFSLFEKYCLPSILNQTNKNFYWFIFFDLSTPEIFRQRIYQLLKSNSKITPHFIDGIESLNESFKSLIHNYIEKNDKYIITTRIDNDDCVHKSFVETIQKNSRNTSGLVIDLIMGYQLQITNGVYECRNYKSKFNPFISVVEHANNFNTVYSRMHRDWKNSPKIISYNKKPLWIEIVHQRNKINDPKYHFTLTNKFKLSDFGVIEELAKRSPSHIAIVNFTILLKRFTKRSKNAFKRILN